MRSDRVLEEIKERIDIVDFIAGYVQLRKSGQNWKGLCPFHTEKTPSFMVSQAKQIYHCFGCGAGGDVIGFLVNYERMTFPEALQVLAEKAGVKLPVCGQDKKVIEKGEQIRNALASAAEFYTRKLNESGSASAYIKKRGITDESISLFRLGINFSPPSRFAIQSFLNAVNGFPNRNLFDGAPVNVYRPGIARGLLKGGNLITLTALLGTEWDINTDGAILFLEEVNEKLYEVVRYLTQWILAGKFRKLKGLILGNFRGIKNRDVYNILSSQMKINFPLVNCPYIGHVKNKITLSVGARVELNAIKKTLTLL